MFNKIFKIRYYKILKNNYERLIDELIEDHNNQIMRLNRRIDALSKALGKEIIYHEDTDTIEIINSDSNGTHHLVGDERCNN